MIDTAVCGLRIRFIRWPGGTSSSSRTGRIGARTESTADPGNAWRCNPSEACHNARNSQVAFGGIIAPDYCAALRQITVVLGQGYEADGYADRPGGPDDVRYMSVDTGELWIQLLILGVFLSLRADSAFSRAGPSLGR
jgi:hypothetical protein